MKQTSHISAALRCAAVLLLSSSVAFGAEKQKRHKPAKDHAGVQAGSDVGVPSGSGISARTENGQTTITYKGRQVFKGATTGQVSALSSSENGTEYAAAFDGDKVLWENTSDAAKHVKNKGVDTNVSAQGLLSKSQKDFSARTGADADIKVTSENGRTKVYYKGKNVFDGETSGKVSAKASSENGTEYAAAFDGGKVIWENTSDAAKHLK